MRFVIQRVSSARVTTGGQCLAAIGPGLLVLAGLAAGDENLPETAAWTAMIEKTLDLRIFPDAQGKMNVSLREASGGLLLVSQFTLYASCRKGRRPSFDAALAPGLAGPLFARLLDAFRERLPGTQSGLFGADMDVSLTNSGPVTITLDSADFVRD